MSESNTLYYERCLGWRGLLIEAAARNFKELRRNRPNATTIHAAVCERSSRAYLTSGDGTAARIKEESQTLNDKRSVRCEPLSRLIAEGLGDGASRIDFLSLDVEGHEPDAVRSLGTAVSFGVMIVEVATGARRVHVMRTLLRRGMRFVGTISGRPSQKNFVMSDVFYNASHFRAFWPHLDLPAAPAASHALV